jgi:hypothetical protein
VRGREDTVQITLKAGMVTGDPAVRVRYRRDAGFDADSPRAVQEAAATIPGAAERGYPTGAEAAGPQGVRR